MTSSVTFRAVVEPARGAGHVVEVDREPRGRDR